MNLFGSCPRLINIEDDFEDVFSNIYDSIAPLAIPPYGLMFGNYKRPRSTTNEDKKYIISITIGKNFEEKDIKIKTEKRKLKISGKSTETLKNGNNVHQFEREYDIPENVDIKTMSSKLSNGVLHVVFDRIHVEPKKEIEYLSNDKEFKVNINLDGFKPEEMKIKLVGNDLNIEATKSSESKSEDGCCHSMSGYVSRTIKIPSEVQLEKIKAVKSESGVEISAPKDPKKAVKTERVLKIENM